MPEKMSRMSEKDKSRIAEKMSEFIMLMGYNADFQVVIAKELGRQIWLSSENLGRKQCRELLYLLYMADSSTLLSFIVSLGRLIWGNHLRAKRRALKRRLSEKIKRREWLKERRKSRGRRARLVAVASWGGKLEEIREWKTIPGFLWARVGFHVRTRFVYRLERHRIVKENVDVGSRVYRLALAMGFLSFRNVCVTSEWEFWAVCLVQQVFGFWRSIAIGGGLSDHFISLAHRFGLDVVPCELLDRLQSCFRCSSTTRYPGYGREFP